MTEVEAYLAALEEPKRGTLEALRYAILEVVPEAEEVISYRVPAFRVGGKTIAPVSTFTSNSTESSDTSKTMAKKKKQTNLPAEFWRRDAEQRANADRILELRRLEREREQKKLGG